MTTIKSPHEGDPDLEIVQKRDGHTLVGLDGVGYSVYPTKEILAALSRTVSTSEDLDALPVGSVVLDAAGDSAQQDVEGAWWYWGGDSPIPSAELQYPATVLHEPTP